MLRICLFLVAFLVSGSTLFGLVASHQESGDWSCEADSEARVSADFRPGVVTLDGHANDWKDVDGFEFPLRPALDPDEDQEYKGGKMNVKALHDGKDVYFLLQVNGDYMYTKGDGKKCPSVSLMFQIGESATYHNMGGCKESTDTCTNKTCQGYEVDIMHFSIGTAVPGRLYGSNAIDTRDGYGGDRYGNLNDMYAWNPHCRNLDGINRSGNDSSAQNDWNGVWWHDSFDKHSGFVEEDSPYASSEQKGTYYFEFRRPLRTMDRLQQDVQFSIGKSSKFSVAFWYPVDGNPWHGSGHYTVSCDWVPLDISVGGSALSKASSSSGGNSWDAASAFALLLSLVSLGVSLLVGYWVFKSKNIPFTPLDNL